MVLYPALGVCWLVLSSVFHKDCRSLRISLCSALPSLVLFLKNSSHLLFPSSWVPYPYLSLLGSLLVFHLPVYSGNSLKIVIWSNCWIYLICFSSFRVHSLSYCVLQTAVLCILPCLFVCLFPDRKENSVLVTLSWLEIDVGADVIVISLPVISSWIPNSFKWSRLTSTELACPHFLLHILFLPLDYFSDLKLFN